jgi:hypothetical protein
MSEEPKEAGDPCERDTQAPEEEDLMALLLPDGQLPRCSAGFALLYNAALFRGWVKQRSPACAAASLAGSWNALLGLSRFADGALDQEDLLVVMRHNLQRTIDRRRDKLDRLLGARFAPIDAVLRARVAREGRSFGGKANSAEGVTPALCIQLLREVVAEALAGEGFPAPLAGGSSQAPLAESSSSGHLPLPSSTICRDARESADAARGEIASGGGMCARAALPSALASAAEGEVAVGASAPSPGNDGRAGPGMDENAAPKLASSTTTGMGRKTSLPEAGVWSAPRAHDRINPGTSADNATSLKEERDIKSDAASRREAGADNATSLKEERDAKPDPGAAPRMDAGAAGERDERAASGCDLAPPATAFLLLDAVMRCGDEAGAAA